MKIHAKQGCYLFFAGLAFSVLCAGCSGDSDEPGRTEKFTEETAHKAVQHIRQPIEKAQQVQDIVNVHTKEMDKAIQQLE
jgi:hypothetical protein